LKKDNSFLVLIDNKYKDCGHFFSDSEFVLEATIFKLA